MTEPVDDGGAPGARLRRRAKLLLALTSVLFALLVAEVALRIAGYSFPVFYTPDQERGYALRPGAEGLYNKEGESYVRINSEGLRDREHTKAKPSDTIRIAVIGDSYAEALQVEQDESFWAVLERRLQECPEFNGGRKVEAINFGVSGYGTAQQLITLRTKVFDYSPDIVLVAFTTNNDITDNSRALKNTEIPYFVVRDGRLTPDNSFRDSRDFRTRNFALNRLGRFIRDHSRVIQLLHQSQRAIKAYIAQQRSPRVQAEQQQEQPAEQNTPPAQTSGQADTTMPAAPVEELGTDNLVYREPTDAIWNEAWQVTEELLKAMRDETAARGARFLVVTVSNGIQVFPVPSARDAFLKRVGAHDIFYPDRRIAALGARENFQVITLAPALQAYADQNQVFLHGFGSQLGNGHWNQLGHRIAGEMIAEKLCQEPAK